MKCVFWFPLQILSQKNLVLGRIQRVIIIDESIRYCCQSLMKVEFLGQILEKF